MANLSRTIQEKKQESPEFLLMPDRLQMLFPNSHNKLDYLPFCL